jgi:hypothetical protein
MSGIGNDGSFAIQDFADPSLGYFNIGAESVGSDRHWI